MDKWIPVDTYFNQEISEYRNGSNKVVNTNIQGQHISLYDSEGCEINTVLRSDYAICHRVQSMQQYSHRNGETDLPKVDGPYWFDGGYKVYTTRYVGILLQGKWESTLSQIIPIKEYLPSIDAASKSVYHIGTEIVDSLDNYVGRWWGPVELIPAWDLLDLPQQNAWEPVNYHHLFTPNGEPIRPDYKAICEDWHEFNIRPHDTQDGYEYAICHRMSNQK